MINFAPTSNLTNLLNNPYANAASAQSAQYTQSPYLNPTGSNNVVPSSALTFPATPAGLNPLLTGTNALSNNGATRSPNGSIFAGATPNTALTQPQQQAYPFTTNSIPQTPTSTGTSNSLGFNLNDLTGLEQQATQVIGQAQQQQGAIGANFRQASYQPVTQPTIIALGDDSLKKLQKGQNLSKVTEEPTENSDLEDKIEELEAKIRETQKTPSNENTERIAALEKELEVAKSSKAESALNTRLSYAEKQIKILKSPQKAEVPNKPKTSTVTAQTPKKSTNT